MNAHLDNPKLTAYALGELAADERGGIEALLRTNGAARAAVSEIQAAAGALGAGFAAELAAGGNVAAGSTAVVAATPVWLGIAKFSAAAAALGLAVGAVFWASRAGPSNPGNGFAQIDRSDIAREARIAELHDQATEFVESQCYADAADALRRVLELDPGDTLAQARLDMALDYAEFAEGPRNAASMRNILVAVDEALIPWDYEVLSPRNWNETWRPYNSRNHSQEGAAVLHSEDFASWARKPSQPVAERSPLFMLNASVGSTSGTFQMPAAGENLVDTRRGARGLAAGQPYGQPGFIRPGTAVGQPWLGYPDLYDYDRYRGLNDRIAESFYGPKSPPAEGARDQLMEVIEQATTARREQADALITQAVQLRIEDKYSEAQAVLQQAYDLSGDFYGQRIGREFEAIEAEVYATFIDNQFKTSYNNPLSTFSIDVDTASYSNIRRYIHAGQLPPRDAVRVEEMLNYFQYDYPPPADERPIAVHVEIASCPWDPSHRLARIGIKAREVSQEQRPPCNLVFLVDVSGSMQSEERLPLIKHGLAEMVAHLNAGDRVAIITYAGEAAIVLDSTPAQHADTIVAAILSLGASGSTNASAGIQTAYDLAVANFIEGGVNRVMLATDGDFNVGVTNREDLVKLISDQAARGVFLTVLGVGRDVGVNDATMEALADKGDGVYAYLDSVEEARRVLVQQAGGTLVTVAKDVKIQVEFNGASVAAYRLIGYENRMLAAKDFNDDTKDAGEIGAGHTVTALYELIPTGADVRRIEETEEIDPAFQENGGEAINRGELVDRGDVDPLKYRTPFELTKAALGGEPAEMLTVKIRFKQPEGGASERFEVAAFDNETHFLDASNDFRFAAAVAGYGMVLRESAYVCGWKVEDALEAASDALGPDLTGARAEFLDLVMETMKVR